MTEQLLEHEKFDYSKSFLEPACGKCDCTYYEGAIVKVLKKYIGDIDYFDINEGRDFFFENNIEYDYIITNPPFSKAFEFIQKSKEIAKEKFAMLLPLSYLHGQKRYEGQIFTDPDYPLTKIYVFTRYPLLEENIREDGKYKTGMMVYAWFIWEKLSLYQQNDRGEIPVIKWIDNNKYVLSKKDLK
jgi:hypothetical protein